MEIIINNVSHIIVTLARLDLEISQEIFVPPVMSIELKKLVFNYIQSDLGLISSFSS